MVSERIVGNPETDRLPVAGSISEWTVIRPECAERDKIQMSAMRGGGCRVVSYNVGAVNSAKGTFRQRNMTIRIVPLLLASCGLFFAGIPAAAQPLLCVVKRCRSGSRRCGHSSDSAGLKLKWVYKVDCHLLGMTLWLCVRSRSSKDDPAAY